MINIRELLQKRAGYAVSGHEDVWIKEVLYSDNIEEWVIVPRGGLIFREDEVRIKCRNRKIYDCRRL